MVGFKGSLSVLGGRLNDKGSFLRVHFQEKVSRLKGKKVIAGLW